MFSRSRRSRPTICWVSSSAKNEKQKERRDEGQPSKCERTPPIQETSCARVPFDPVRRGKQPRTPSMTLGHRAAEPHEQTSRESRFPGYPKEPMRLAVSVPSRPMVKILDAQNSIKEKEQCKYHCEVQHDDGDPDVTHSINKRNLTVELTRRREFIQASPDQRVSTGSGSDRLCFHAPAARVQRFVRWSLIIARVSSAPCVALARSFAKC